MNTNLTRRQAITTMSAATAGLAGLASIAPASTLATLNLGFDESTSEYTLPDLPYAYKALSPHIDPITMTIHHTKHHAGYVKGLNKALKQLHAIRSEKADPGTLQHWQRQLAFHAGGHINHTLFWEGMSPDKNNGGVGGGDPTGSLAKAITRDFGSIEKFNWQFKAAAKSVEGSGWGWLIYEPISKRLMITQMQNQQDMMFAGAIPLLGVDVWEHAYYLSYQNRRGDYLNAFMNIINWPEIQRRYNAATT
ncbi:MAG: superoxide dismutase [Phycisphaerales bacterium]|nr:superoxide dismutase [Phycisphaerales bacterium]